MFNSLTTKLDLLFKNIKGGATLTEKVINDSILTIRNALIEADVSLIVVNKFIDSVKKNATGEKINKSLNPSQALTKIVYDNLVSILGNTNEPIKTRAKPPIIILLAGLQGSGKTTTAAKLALKLKKEKKLSVMLTSTDIYRPAAINQLEILSQQTKTNFYVSEDKTNVINMVQDALNVAKKKMLDVLIVDTAGRLHIDDIMLTEIKEIHNAINPNDTIYVADSMSGQEAANTAKSFSDVINLTGVILTKVDADSRGGAALSIKHSTGAPIKYIGVGEKIEDLEDFHPERVASSILNMGDILSLVESIEKNTDKNKLSKNLNKKNNFTLNEFKEQFVQLNNMGGISKMIKKMPGLANVNESQLEYSNGFFAKSIAIINSMTKKEKNDYKIINSSRKKRIALGSGTELSDVNDTLNKYNQMRKVMKKMKKPGAMKGLMQNLSNPFNRR